MTRDKTWVKISIQMCDESLDSSTIALCFHNGPKPTLNKRLKSACKLLVIGNYLPMFLAMKSAYGIQLHVYKAKTRFE